MKIRLLGPLEISDNSGLTTRITSAKQRVVFAALALRPGEVVSAERLVDCLWGDNPPVTARETVHSHVTRLRRILPVAERARIVTRAPGYLLDAEFQDVDLYRVRDLHKAAVAAAEYGDEEKAAILLTEAQNISRGALLADVDSELLRQRHVPAWEEFHAQLTEARIDAEMALGNHAGVLGELRSLVAEQPLAEHFRGRLMLALHATGQAAEALREYQRGRQALLDGLGVEPGQYLRSAQQKILAPAAPVAEPKRARPSPAELPHAIRGFVGREPELAELDKAAVDAGIVVVHGMGGIGKTTTAIHWAHHARDRFPDGQLYLNLRGFDHTEAPMRPAEALPRLLHSIGVPPGSVPSAVDEQAARLRSLLADRRTLVLLDNAADTDQVRPLLPGGEQCLVLVTSRTRLSGLIAREHAAAVQLDPFSPVESTDLLAGYLGSARLRNDQAGATALAEYCGHVPLALSIVAARALEGPGLSLTELTAQLRAGQRLDAFELTGENLRTVFSWSYQALSADAARLFRLLAVHPGQTVSVAGVAALAAADRVGEALAELTRSNLLDQHSAGRYRCHDLLRDYAAELVAEDPEGSSARQRILDWYLQTTAAAERWLRPHRPPFELAEPAATVIPVEFPDNQSAMRWCETEQANLAAAIDSAAGHGLHEHAWQMALAFSSFCYVGKRRRDWVETSEIGLGSARALGDPKAEGAMLASLGSAHAVNGQYDEAIALFLQALELHRTAGDHDREPVTLNSMAVAYAETRRFEPALAAFTQARELHRVRGNALGEALALMNIALANSSLGRLEQAAAHNREALAVFRRRGDRYHTAICLGNLAETYALREDHRRAIARYRQAIEQHILAGNDYGRARTLMNLGHSLSRLGDHHRARDCWRRAMTLFEALGDPQEAEAADLLAVSAKSR